MLDAKFGLDFFKNPFAHMLVFSSSGFGFIIILPSLNILITTERIPSFYVCVFVHAYLICK